jgi:hypothetical protein
LGVMGKPKNRFPDSWTASPNTTASSEIYSVLGYCVDKRHFYDNALLAN